MVPFRKSARKKTYGKRKNLYLNVADTEQGCTLVGTFRRWRITNVGDFSAPKTSTFALVAGLKRECGNLLGRLVDNDSVVDILKTARYKIRLNWVDYLTLRSVALIISVLRIRNLMDPHFLPNSDQHIKLKGQQVLYLKF
jgi:hypothetical protein